MLDWGPGIDDAWQVVRRDRTAGDGHYGRHRTHIDAVTACINLHRDWLTGVRISHMGDTGATLAARIAELRGLDLGCWCPLGSPCHADTLLELANPTPVPIAGRDHHDSIGDLRVITPHWSGDEHPRKRGGGVEDLSEPGGVDQ